MTEDKAFNKFLVTDLEPTHFFFASSSRIIQFLHANLNITEDSCLYLLAL